MSLTRIKMERFTAFERLDVSLSPGINIFIGENGTGKTHILKATYAACDVSKTGGTYAGKLTRVFRPYEDRVGRLVYRTGKSSRGSVAVHRGVFRLRSSFSNHAKSPANARLTGKKKWTSAPVESVYIPVKEMLANAPGFRSLYANRDVAFSEVYADVVDRALRPLLRGPHTPDRKRLLRSIQSAMEGKVQVKEETFFLTSRRGKLEFSLVSEGVRKLALIWLLVQNGTLLENSILFWDEPEANLNPRKVGALADILLELQRMGVQILLATHDYVLLKELSLRSTSNDSLRYHALYRDDGGVIQHQDAPTFLGLSENAIAATIADLYNREIDRSLGKPMTHPHSEGELEFRFPEDATVTRFDGPQHGLSHVLSAVDFVVELPERILFIEVKDPECSRAPSKERSRFATALQVVRSLGQEGQGHIPLSMGAGHGRERHLLPRSLGAFFPSSC